MEAVGFVQEMLQSVAEYAVSYRLGQSVLRVVDRVLWTVEKCARWAVPPPLDQDEHPQPELIRPLPWVFFLALLIVLRVTRESISLVNLVLGKPPLRSADVVTYIQGKRRYLRTLKYQGNRMMRARSTPGQPSQPSQLSQPSQPWYSGAKSLFEFTMCFRRNTRSYGNNNTTIVSNNDEVLVIKRNKRGTQEASPVASTSESTMERLIEKMMVDLQADSDDDSSYTLTNPTSGKSDQSEAGEDSEQEPSTQNDVSTSHLSKCQSNDSCQDVTSTTDSLSREQIEDTRTSQVRIETESSSIALKSERTSPKEETDRLLQSERGLTTANQKQPPNHKPCLVNGKSKLRR